MNIKIHRIYLVGDCLFIIGTGTFHVHFNFIYVWPDIGSDQMSEHVANFS
jgi:hypothetical protein